MIPVAPRVSFAFARTGLLCLTSLTGLALPALAQSGPIDAAQRESVVERIAVVLEERYVFEDIAQQCGEHLKAELGAGKYDELVAAEEFADTLTRDLQSVSKDKHMRVRARAPERARARNGGDTGRADPMTARQQQLDRSRRSNFGFERVERLEGNVGYVDMRSFAPIELGRDTAAAALAFIANTDAVIFDMRQNGGGSPDMVQFVCSYFFGERTHLNSLYWREGDVTQEFWTLEELPGQRLPDVPLFVLTSKRTFSGAEEFSYNLRTRERATLVGETTGGGANPGGTVSIDERFGIFIPTGRAINPVTGTNWEGVGVDPHIAVPAEEALDRTLALARESAEAYRESRSAKRAELWANVTDRLRAAEKLFADGNPAEGTRSMHAALKLGSESAVLEEDSINMLGYERLQKGSVDASIAIFRFNTSTYPESFNVWDSLGEAYMEKGEKSLAIQNYEKSLKLNPENANAVRMIESMRGD